jgi:hypothetical protein
VAGVATLYRIRRLDARRRDSVAIGVERLPSLMLINLAGRPDRLSGFVDEMTRLGIENFTRFDAIPARRGILGCSQSHASVLGLVLEHSWDSMMVCEDDARFLVDRAELDVLIEAFLDDPVAEVACLAYNHQAAEIHSSLFLRSTNVQTTACYLIKSTIAEELLAVWDEGIQELERDGDRMTFGLDIIWKRLQSDHVFLIPVRRAVYQEAGYSDVEEAVVNYGV